ncbi:hypothetical protein J7413_14455 [Shimia sp. R10_1]|uniref:hypothetical protein n=1 Tax=Shimia sp. R10_1 TaxID=2821095 RepID=UPI001ADAD2F4|nr:hypothetical protein [Shimia sp. R10_1]MBO9474748.1 hypothetical protein [Shimia sp. R10_1]
MKGSNSRLSHKAENRFSNVAHIQGGMVTDSDLTAAAQIHQARDEAQNAVTLWSGCPARDGAVAIDETGRARLKPGWIVAQGKQGWLAQAEGAEQPLPQDQADLPLGAPMMNRPALVYADLWERPIFAAQDRALTDPGLHGAETSYRTRTMVQIKTLPLADEAALAKALQALEDNTGVFARSGDAEATIVSRSTEIATDECDPCADQIDITPVVPNALFRFEIISVEREDNVARRLVVAWSVENAAAIMPVSALDDISARDAFARPGAVYEFYSEATEAHIGRFVGMTPERPVMTDVLFPAPAAGTANGGDPYAFVRRWDGFAEIDLISRNVTNTGTGSVTVGEAQLTLNWDAFALNLATKDNQMLAGDYWLVELRRFASEEERVRLVSALPLGVDHHFCPLFRISDDGTSEPLTDEEKRRLSFPTLSDIPASHVRFAPECPPLFHDAKNVQEALNALCDLDATEVAFDPGENCPRFEGANTVDAALKRMCQFQDDSATTRLLRLMMDWGVICGVSLNQEERTKISWTGGTVLDRAGRLIEVPDGAFDLSELDEEHILSDIADTMEKEGELCLSVAAEKDGQLGLYVSDRRTAFGPTDRTFSQAVQACLDGKKRVDFGDFFRPLTPADSKVVEGMVQVWANRKTLSGAVPMTEAEEQVAQAFNKTLLADYKAKVSPERGATIDKLISLAEIKYNPESLRGANRDLVRMQRESAKLGIIANSEEEDRRACECKNGLVPCPPDAGDMPHLVPIGCFRTDPTGAGKITNMQELCHFCCRKQSLNWRSHRYYFGESLEERFAVLSKQCCDTKEPPSGDFDDWLDDWDSGIFKPYPMPQPLPHPLPKPDPLWPPKVPPDFGGTFPPVIGGGPLPRPGLVTPLPGKDFTNIVNIDTLPPARAEESLVGNGFTVVDTIDLDEDVNPLTKLEELGLKGGVRSGKDIGEPGDRVAMLVRGGKTVDYVVVEKGNGRLPFETDTELTARVTKALKEIEQPADKTGKQAGFAPAPATPPAVASVDLSAADAMRAALEEERTRAESSVRELIATREALSADVTTLRADIDTLTKAREEAAVDIERSRNEFAAIEASKAASLRELSEAISGLEIAKKDAEEAGRSIRSEQPARTLLGRDDNALRVFEENGLLSVGDIANSNTNRLSAIIRRAGMNISASDLKLKATDVINRR